MYIHIYIYTQYIMIIRRRRRTTIVLMRAWAVGQDSSMMNYVAAALLTVAV